MQLAGEVGYEVRETAIPREMVYVADELFFTGTAAEVTPIRSVDRVPVGRRKPGPDHAGASEGCFSISSRMGTTRTTG